MSFTMSSSTNLPSFSNFSALPTEIRLRIWQFAAPRRPRVIQVGYDPDKSCWKAWKDGLGGLPSIVHVSREAREAALKPYDRIFDAYVDPEEDTIFISDVRLAPTFYLLGSVLTLTNSFYTAETSPRALPVIPFALEIFLTEKILTRCSHSQYSRYENLGTFL